MNVSVMLAMGLGAALLAAGAGLYCTSIWQRLVIEQRLTQLKGTGDRRLVRWEDVLAALVRPLRRSRDVKPWKHCCSEQDLLSLGRPISFYWCGRHF